ncbi:hypothetical protein BC828DRAFT_379522 [Blastocladiella britannica]|nr:hypothetical protein BC828DRAFT_379522 [Blastocladiella britannica]
MEQISSWWPRRPANAPVSPATRHLTTDPASHLAHLHATYCSNRIRSTKYTPLTFLPKNLLEQFSRAANQYFLLTVVLQLIPQVQTFDPAMAAYPLACVMAIAAAKDAVEDWRRHLSDRQLNASKATVLRRLQRRGHGQSSAHHQQPPLSANGGGSTSTIRTSSPPSPYHGSEHDASWTAATWEQLRVGDMVLLRKGDAVPADLLLVGASGPHGACYVETKSLDGETNLKLRHACPEIALETDASDAAAAVRVDIETEPPNPNLHLFRGTATISSTNGPESHALSMDNLLLRGCVLRNTAWAVGIAVYTGHDTKLWRNAGTMATKRTPIDHWINRQIMANLALLAVLCGVCAIAAVSWGLAPNVYGYRDSDLWESVKLGGVGGAVAAFFACMTIFSNLVPLGVYICVDFIKLFQSYFIGSDIKLMHRGIPCSTRSWAVSDALGQIDYVFSDKTGTLTQNQMRLRSVWIAPGSTFAGDMAGWKGGDASNERTESTSKGGKKDDAVTRCAEHFKNALLRFLPNPYMTRAPAFAPTRLVRQLANPPDPDWATVACWFWIAVAVCHTVVVDDGEGGTELKASASKGTKKLGTTSRDLQYGAQSPDEHALVNAARELGFVFLGRDANGKLKVRMPAALARAHGLSVEEAENHALSRDCAVLQCELVHAVAFDSDRKRMTTVVRIPCIHSTAGATTASSNTSRKHQYRAFVFTKGADTTLLPRVRTDQSSIAARSIAALEDFAAQGLRTLMYAYRELTATELDSMHADLHAAASLLDTRREDAVAAVAASLERDLALLGVTAIEDRLQDGVPEAITALDKAGVHVWVLTGDKIETAINVGHACRLICDGMAVIVVRGGDAPETAAVAARLAAVGAELETTTTASVLVIDGDALRVVFHPANEQVRADFLALCLGVRHVMCCRVSPLQKAQIVLLVKATGAVTLAIGDGANDVGMIQAADVGIGIAGEEGMQAVLSADIAVGQFRFLTRLMLVHGRWAAHRMVRAIGYYLYKRVALIFIYFWFQFVCGYDLQLLLIRHEVHNRVEKYNRFSAALLYDYTFITIYYSIFTLLPLSALGILDQDVPEAWLERYPQLYSSFRVSIAQPRYPWILLEAAVHGLLCVSIPFGVYWDASAHPNGYSSAQVVQEGMNVAFGSSLAVHLILAAHMRRMPVLAVFSALYSAVTILMFAPAYALIPGTALAGTAADMLTAPSLWLSMPVTVAACIVPRVVAQYWSDHERPDDAQIVREMAAMDVLPPVPTSVSVAAAAVVTTTSGVRASSSALQQPLSRSGSRRSNASSLASASTTTAASAGNDDGDNGLGGHRPQSTAFRGSLIFDAETQVAVPHTGYAFAQAAGLGETIATTVSVELMHSALQLRSSLVMGDGVVKGATEGWHGSVPTIGSATPQQQSDDGVQRRPPSLVEDDARQSLSL